MAKMKNGQTLRKIHPDKLMLKPKVKPDWGHKWAALDALMPEGEPYEQPQTLGKNGVILHGRNGFQIDDVTGRQAVAQFRRPNGTPSYFEVFGKTKPVERTVGENMMILRAWMHLKGLPPIPEEEPITTFGTVFGRFVLPRRLWPLFGGREQNAAEAFIAEWAAKLFDEANSGKTAKAQTMLPGWALADRAAFYTKDSIATERRFTRERGGYGARQ